MNTVTVYTRTRGPRCMGCVQTKRHLDRRHITYTEIDVDDDPNIAAALAYLGLTSLPVVLAATSTGEQSWSGYRPDRIDELAATA